MTDPPKPLQTDGLPVDSVDAPEALRRYLIGTQYETMKQAKGLSAAGYICETYHISLGTVEKYGRYSRAVDAVAKVSPNLAQSILAGSIRLSQEAVITMSKRPAHDIEAGARRLLSASVDSPLRYQDARMRLTNAFAQIYIPTPLSDNERSNTMTEKMLVTQALDERDLLVKKIGDKIDKLRVADLKKRNEDKVIGASVAPDEFVQAVTSAYQQIIDLIDRYQRLDAAIVASNAEHFVETSRGKYTVAGAIALRARLKGNGVYAEHGAFEEALMEQLQNEINTAIRTAETRNKAVESQAESMRLAILGRDGKIRDSAQLDVVDTFVRENTTEVIDPLDAKTKCAQLQERIDAMLSELDTQIKVSNATTTIEF